MMRKKFYFVFPESLFREVKTHLLKEKNLETQGFLFGTLVDTANGKKILIRDFWVVPENEYEERTGVAVRPSGSFLNKAATFAFINNFVFIDVHTHPFAKKAWFSSMDRKLAEDIKRWVQNFKREKGKDFWYAHMVMTPEDVYGEVLDPETLEYVPATIKILKTPLELKEQQSIVLPERFDRSIRVWARENQERLSQVKVAIVGLGGLGWNIAESLTRIGVRRFTLIDGDKIEESNLSRLIGAKPKEIGKYKVEAMFQRIMEFWNGNAEVDIYPEFLSKDNMSKLKNVDVIVGAVDNQLARLLLNKASTRYLIPYFDIGIRIDAERNTGGINLRYQGGQIFFVNPGTTPCLACYDGFFDFFEIAQELMSEEEKQIRRELGYVTNTEESPSPNVLPPNLFAVSLFTNVFVNFITGIGDVPPLIHFDLTKGSVKYYKDLNRYEFCGFCSNKYGKLALGDLKFQRVFVPENQNSRNISSQSFPSSSKRG